jgi:transposase
MTWRHSLKHSNEGSSAAPVRSRRRDDQPQLFDEPAGEQPDDGATDSDDGTTTVRPRTRTKRGRKPLPESIEREEIVLDIPEEDKHCGCGHDLVRIGEEVSEKLTIIPARFIVTRYIRPKYACHHCEGSGDEDKPAVRIRPMPPAVIPRGIATPSLLAFIITGKYVDGMPLKRQETSFARIGVDLPRQRMADWVMTVGEALKPVMDQLYHLLRAGPFFDSRRNNGTGTRRTGQSRYISQLHVVCLWR